MVEILSFLFGISLATNIVLMLLIKFYFGLKKNEKAKLLEIVDSAEAEDFLSWNISLNHTN